MVLSTISLRIYSSELPLLIPPSPPAIFGAGESTAGGLPRWFRICLRDSNNHSIFTNLALNNLEIMLENQFQDIYHILRSQVAFLAV